MADAVPLFRRAFRWQPGPLARLAWIDERDADAARELRESSVLGRHLVEQVRSSRQWRPIPREPRFPVDATRLEAKPLGLSGAARLAPGREPDRFGFELFTRFGAAVAWIGDLDDDGEQDLAVGAPNDSWLGHFHGTLWTLRRGDGGVRATEIGEANGALPEQEEFGQLGAAVASLGDLDGDGRDEIVVGAPGWDGVAEDVGGVWIVFLGPDGAARRTVELVGTPVLRSASVGPHAGLGASLACLGDLDGDGLPELAIGQDPRFDQGRSVFVVSLDASGAPRRARRIRGDELGLPEGYSWLGDALAGVGDVDGDGVPDLAVGDPGDEDGGVGRGAVWIVRLARDGAPRASTKISDQAGGFDGLLRDEAGFGGSLAAPGDLDGDGARDLVVGDHHGLWVLSLRTDGSVARHRRYAFGSDPLGPGPLLGGALACGPALADERGGLRLAVGGRVEGADQKLDGVVWLLRLMPDGSLASL
jgi:hypothetical protein